MELGCWAYPLTLWWSVLRLAVSMEGWAMRPWMDRFALGHEQWRHLGEEKWAAVKFVGFAKHCQAEAQV